MPEARARWAVFAVFAATLLLATRRLLTFDEAYYLAAARDLVATRSVPIDDHPPLLLVGLAAFDRLPLPIELRVRLCSASFATATALTLGALARATGGLPSRALVLASVGVLPVLSGLVATPDTPLLLGEALLLLGLARERLALAFVGALVACAAKASGYFVVALALFWLWTQPRRLGPMAATLVGALAALPFAHRSLSLQAAHVLGHGPLVSSPVVGVPLALAGIAGAVVLAGPALIAFSRDLAAVPAGRPIVYGTLLALGVSAVVSGRAPEAGWIGPAVPIWIVAAARVRWSKAALTSYVAPTLLGIMLWLLPRGPFEGRAPSQKGPPWPVSPAYGQRAWSRVYP